MTILVTGAAGFIGFHVSRRLLARGEQVIGLDVVNDYYSVSLKEDRLRTLAEEHGEAFRFIRCDFADREQLASALDGVEIDAVERPEQRFVVGEIALDRREGLAMIAAQPGIPVALQDDAVIIVEIVDPDHFVAAAHEPVGEMMADEAGGAGHEDFH